MQVLLDLSVDSTLTSYQVGDVGQVSDIIEVDDRIINSWDFNDTIPCTTRRGFLTNINTVWYTDNSTYVYTSSIPDYNFFRDPQNDTDLIPSEVFLKMDSILDNSLEHSNVVQKEVQKPYQQMNL